eukprot:NODE_59_length_2953_cov_150.918259_g56_i0.p1 GENE.NODE_59_length_2953_cov_150.918259_g56_i0~~NODE_59_length_2953_cov_150.918259_g56_i0.p1  ORF type:complete len:323 (-),score=-27.59 NODE_59_length_2953_cov_150.918259_g56_i0:1059-2027(-)
MRLVKRALRVLIRKATNLVALNARTVITNKVAPTYSRYRFGNTISADLNFAGHRNWKKARKAFTVNERKHYTTYLRRGYANISDAIDEQLCQRMGKQFRETINDPSLTMNPSEDASFVKAYTRGLATDVPAEVLKQEFGRHYNAPERVFANYRDIFSDRLVSRIRNCIGTNFFIENFYAWRNYHCPKEIVESYEAYANRFHFDSQYNDRIKFFIYLSEVDDSCGPFQHFDRVYSRKLLSKGLQENARKWSIYSGVPEEEIDKRQLVRHTGPIGTGLICSTSFCFHCAGIPAPGRHRDVLQFVLAPSIEMNLDFRTKETSCME